MSKKMLIDATHPEETRVVVADGNKVEDFDFESINKRQLAGNIYLAKVTRVEPSLQAAFVEYGGNRHGFLAFSEIHPDYYQIPVADREALLAEEERDAQAEAAREDAAGDGAGKRPKKGRHTKDDKEKKERRSRSKKASAEPAADDAAAGTPTAEAETANSPEATATEGAAQAPESSDAPHAEPEPPKAEAKPKRGRRGSRAKAKPAATSSGLDVIDLDAPSEPQAPGGDVPKGLEVAEAAAPTAPDDSASPASDAASPDAAAAPDTPEAPDASGHEASDEGGDQSPKSIAEAAGLDEETVTEEVAAPADEDAPEERKSRSRSRRGGRSKPRGKGRDKEKSADPAEAAQTDAAEDSEEDGKPEAEIEQSGADDPREEVQQQRAVRRRRYKIQDVIKVRQIMLVQVVKEERGNKGAALTTYLSLAGRYGVLMPNTARGGGISRKITNAPDRKRLREIVGELDVPRGMGLIVRTAGAERTRPEIKRDYEFLLRQWEQIRELTLKSIAPCLIYEEGSLIKRVIRDSYSKEIEAIFVEGDAGYREAKDYMKMLMPSHAKNVKQYADPIPLFIRYQVESYLNGMFSPTVQLKSGGYIVIGITEALVAIDVNSGRSTKEGSVEDTALKTNLEAADEIARQLRLRDLAGLIVIDFIDMDENRNNRAVEKRMKDRLRTDRARIQLGRISAFGLMEMSRQRLRPGMLEASTAPCPHCHATGIIRSSESLSLAILREVEEEGLRDRTAEVIVTCPVEIANFLINSKRAHVAGIEERHGLKITVFGDPTMVSPDYKVERIRASGPVKAEPPAGSRHVTASGAASGTASGATTDPRGEETDMPAAQAGSTLVETPEDSEGDDGAKRRRRGKRGGRRRRRGNGDEQRAEPGKTVAKVPDDASPAVAEEAPAAEAEEKPKRRSRGGRTRKPKAEETPASADAPAAPGTQAGSAGADAGADAGAAQTDGVVGAADGEASHPEPSSPAAEGAAEPNEGTDERADAGPEPESEPATPAAASSEEPPELTADTVEEPKEKKRGWWSFGF